MAGSIEIANIALAKIGASRITSFDEDSPEAEVLNTLYSFVRDDEIAKYNWNFAKTRRRLPSENSTPAFGWRYQYLMPSDCLRVLEVGQWPMPVMSNLIVGETRPFVIEGGRIMSNRGNGLDVLYLRRVEDTSEYPAIFLEVFTSALAKEISFKINKSSNVQAQANQYYENALAKAKKVDAIDTMPIMIQDGSWMVAHRMGVI